MGAFFYKWFIYFVINCLIIDMAVGAIRKSGNTENYPGDMAIYYKKDRWPFLSIIIVPFLDHVFGFILN